MQQTDTTADGADAPTQTHAPALIAIHWLTGLLVGCTVAVVLLRDVIDVDGAERLLLDAHRSLGSGVLFLLAVRVVTRVARRTPAASRTSRWMHLAAAGAHAALYALMIAVPVAGWLATNASGKPVSLLGLVTLPTLIGRDIDLADTLDDVHSTLAWTFLAVIAVHAAAALWHHFVLRDGTLRRMLPILPLSAASDRRS